MGEWDDLLINTVTIMTVRVTRERDKSSKRHDPVAVAVDVPCSIESTGGSRTVVQGREGQNITHRVYFGTNRAIKPGSLLRPTSPSGPDLYVLDWLDPTAGTGSAWAADCEQRT